MLYCVVIIVIMEGQTQVFVTCCVALRCVALRCVALRCVALRCVALCYDCCDNVGTDPNLCHMLCCVVLCCVVLCCVVLCCVVLCCVVLCCVVLCCVVIVVTMEGQTQVFVTCCVVLCCRDIDGAVEEQTQVYQKLITCTHNDVVNDALKQRKSKSVVLLRRELEKRGKSGSRYFLLTVTTTAMSASD